MKQDTDHSKYYSQELSQTWTYDRYKDVYTRAKWSWNSLPFSGARNTFADWNRAPASLVKGSIIEIGSACGNAYQFLANSGLVDTSMFYGFEVSDFGVKYCKEKYQNANWVNGDFTKVALERRFDYGFERHAIHHMPDPLAQYEKVLSKIDKSFATTFVSCVNGDTISDLNKARYRHPTGDFVYFDIINPFQIMEIGRDFGFNHFDIYLSPEHEAVESDPLAHQYISPDINVHARMIGRTTLILSKTDAPLTVTFNSPYTAPGKQTLGAIRTILNPIRRRNMAIERVVNDRIARFKYGKIHGF